jgi:hypothetical protein
MGRLARGTSILQLNVNAASGQEKEPARGHRHAAREARMRSAVSFAPQYADNGAANDSAPAVPYWLTVMRLPARGDKTSFSFFFGELVRRRCLASHENEQPASVVNNSSTLRRSAGVFVK